MKKIEELRQKVLIAAADNGINSILFRNALSRRLGLNVTESACLSLLGIKGISTPKELSRYSGLTSGSTTAMLDRLEKRKFIKRSPNPKDRRGIIIEIDSEYAQKASSLVKGIQLSHKELIESYSEKDLEVITDFLNKFTQNIIKHTEEVENAD